ncbi:MAG: metallophosphoesterase, partial [Bacteroidota bacterium]
MNWIIFIAALFVLFLIDVYVFQGIKILIRKWPSVGRKAVNIFFWGTTGYIILAFLVYKIFGPQALNTQLQRFTTVFFFIVYITKVPALVFLIFDDLIRFIKWITVKLSEPKQSFVGQKISRSQFLVKASVVAAAVPAASLGFGMLNGAYDYRVRRKRVPIKDLPNAFHGLRIGQISDIHSGSFYNRQAVQGGVDLMLKEKPDLFVFTGDLVNNETSEVKEYKDIFARLKAPLGSFSTLGNHDYGDYRSWSSAAAKQKNLDDIVRVHKEMGWDLLRNDNRTVKIDGEELAIIGVDNWGVGRFAKYGDIEKAYDGIKEKPTKILLSHDP